METNGYRIMKLLERHRSQEGFTLTSLMVSMTIMGLIIPMVGDMLVTAARAQAKSANYADAEYLANTFAGNSRAKKGLSEVPKPCDLKDQGNNVYTITCTKGRTNQARAVAERTFEIVLDSTGSANSNSDPEYTPGYWCPHFDPDGSIGFNTKWGVTCNPESVTYTPGIYCPHWDPFGLGGYNNDHKVLCNPHFNL